LALGIVCFHSVTITTGSAGTIPPLLRALAQLILPGFFCLSGYLVAGSLSRCGSTAEFLVLRALRIVPAFSLVIAASALILGPLVSTLAPADYYGDPSVAAYFQNMLGMPHYTLPGVFTGNPRTGIVNGSLWTIPLEVACYLLLAVLALASRRWLFNLLLVATIVLLLFPRLPFLGLALAWLPAKHLPLAFLTGVLLHRLARFVPLNGTCAILAFVLCLAIAWNGPAPPLEWLCLPLCYVVVWLGTHNLPPRLTRADYSYGLYLAAYPVQQLYMQLFPGMPLWWMNLLFALPLALLCAGALWHGVERPILARKHELAARLIAARPVALVRK
jgi:peptidoglycan/LPS O-acetylase OafA/YrhL